MEHPSLNRLVAAALTGWFMMVATACPDDDKKPVIGDGESVVSSCTANEQCPQGHICDAGTCLIGACDPLLETACDVDGLDSPYCCKPWEICRRGPLTTVCAADPDSRGIGCGDTDRNCTPCEVQDDCAAGQFCSGAACFDAAGRTSCTSSFQCPGGERCDRTVFLCVPDRGGCSFCGPEFPELCCEEGQKCSEQSGFCQDIPEAECDDDRPCSAGLICDDVQRCVQCLEDADCGPGLACDEGAGSCYSLAAVCQSDADCLGNKRCAVARQECVIPQCQSNSQCAGTFDARWRCDVTQFNCYLPPAVCTEDDEDNDTVATATRIENFTYAGTLCRDDTDHLSFPVIPGKRYSVDVRFAGSGQPGITAALLDTSQLVESSASFSATQAAVQLAGVTGPDESGFFTVKITGSNMGRDSWAYQVTVIESEPSPPAECTPQPPEEPNDAFDKATLLTSSVAGVTRTFSRCGTGDVDYYRIPVPPQHGIDVLVWGFLNAEGNINAELYKAPNAQAGSRVDQATGITDVEALDAPEGPAEFWLKVFLGSTSGALDAQRYTLTVKEVPRPAACMPDIHEPENDALATAPLMDLTPDPVDGDLRGSAEALRCNAQDVDHVAFNVPANRSAVVRLRFNHNEGNLKLEVLASDGTVIGTSDVSTATTDPDEQVSVPGNPTESRTYVARVLQSGSATSTIAQPYTIEVDTYDDTRCLASEPAGGDNTFTTGICLGVPSLYASSFAACTTYADEPLAPDCEEAPEGTPGCGLVCGSSDSDFFRVGRLESGQALHAVVTYDAALGAIDVARSTLTAAGGVPAETVVAGVNGRAEIWHVETSATPREYAVRVKPRGNTGHQQQPYQLLVEVGPKCADDAYDLGAAVNERPSQATPVALDPARPTVIQASRCNDDTDVYELILIANERLTFSLVQQDPSPAGLQAELGLRPDNLNTIPTAVVTSVAGGEPATYETDIRRIVYLTVRPVTPATRVTGPYTLTLSVGAIAAGE